MNKYTNISNPQRNSTVTQALHASHSTKSKKTNQHAKSQNTQHHSYCMKNVASDQRKQTKLKKIPWNPTTHTIRCGVWFTRQEVAIRAKVVGLPVRLMVSAHQSAHGRPTTQGNVGRPTTHVVVGTTTQGNGGRPIRNVVESGKLWLSSRKVPVVAPPVKTWALGHSRNGAWFKGTTSGQWWKVVIASTLAPPYNKNR